MTYDISQEISLFFKNRLLLIQRTIVLYTWTLLLAENINFWSENFCLWSNRF